MVVDGGMVSLEVVSKAGPDTHCKVVDPGLILSRANLTFRREGEIIRARNAMLPVLSSKVSAGAKKKIALAAVGLPPSWKRKYLAGMLLPLLSACNTWQQ